MPPMYSFESFITSQKPKEIATYDTITIPFDRYIWSFAFGSICAQFLLLVIMQHLYSKVSGMQNCYDFIYEGVNGN